MLNGISASIWIIKSRNLYMKLQPLSLIQEDIILRLNYNYIVAFFKHKYSYKIEQSLKSSPYK